MNINENIRKYRLQKGFSIKDLARAIEVSESTISRYENGKREPNMETLSKIATILNIQLSQLIDNKESLTIKLIKTLEINFKTDAENTLELICELIDIDTNMLNIALKDNKDIPENCLSKMLTIICNDDPNLFYKFYFENKELINDYPICYQTCDTLLKEKEKEFQNLVADNFYYSPLIEAFKTIVNKNDKDINAKLDNLSNKEIDSLKKVISEYIEFQLSKIHNN